MTWVTVILHAKNLGLFHGTEIGNCQKTRSLKQSTICKSSNYENLLSK